MSSKLWAGRFSEPTEKIVDEFNASINIDKRMALYDIKGSIAHVQMLGRQKILTDAEAREIETGLNKVYEEIKTGKFKFNISDEDIHMAIERRLIALIGDVGGKLHTARSRNDQVAVDFRMYMKDGIIDVKKALANLMKQLTVSAEKHMGCIMPGYTHLQSAQPVTYAHYLLSYFQMFRRDYERMTNIITGMDYCPLGAGALAGTPFPIDRKFVSEKLGFKAPTENSIDSVSDRDFAIEFLAAASISMMHLSRFCEEIIIHTSSEFAFMELSDGFCTGSSIMPQKKNPDIPELIRGKTGRVYGDLIGLLTIMKGIPLAYNKDMQEDKEGVFDALDTLLTSLRIFEAMLAKLTVNSNKMLAAAKKGYATATDLADYLVRKGLPFRQAHHTVGRIVQFAISNNKMLEELTAAEFKGFSSLIDDDIYASITVEASVNNRKSYGGTGGDPVKVQLDNAKAYVKKVS